MLLENLRSIVVRNYGSLVEEGGSSAKIRVALLFGLTPIIIGTLLGYYSPLWSEIIAPLISAIGVLTGFSINAIVLLSGNLDDDSYPLEQKHLRQTNDLTLYSILVGFCLLIVLVFGAVTANIDIVLQEIPNQYRIVTATQVLSVIVYTLTCHYFVVLLSVTHRLYTLVHSGSV